MEISLMDLHLTPGVTVNADSGLPAIKDLGWQPGQILQGTVLEQVAENAYTIRVDGKDVTALSPYALAKDQVITMEVQGQNDGKYMVRLLDSFLSEQEDVLKTVTRQLGVEDNSFNRVLIRDFLAQELPLKPEILQKTARMLQITGGNFDADTVLLALKWGAPPKLRVMEALQAFLTGFREAEAGSESQLSSLLEQFSDLLNEVQGKSQPLAGEVTTSFKQASTLLTASEQGLVPGGTGGSVQANSGNSPPISANVEGDAVQANTENQLIGIVKEGPVPGGTGGSVQANSGNPLPISANVEGGAVQANADNQPLGISKGGPVSGGVGGIVQGNSENPSPIIASAEGAVPAVAEGTIQVSAEAQPIRISKEALALYQQVKELLGGMILNPGEGTEKLIDQLRNIMAFQLPKLVQEGAELQSEFITEGVKRDTEEIAQGKQGTSSSSGSEVSLTVSRGKTPEPGMAESAIKNAQIPFTEDAGQAEQNVKNEPGRATEENVTGPVGEGKEAASKHSKNIRAFSDLLETFGRLLQEIRESVKEAGFQKDRSIVHEGTRLEKQMAGHQIFQSLEKENSQQDYLYFNLPFIKNGESETWGQLRIMKDASGKKIIDPKRFSTVIFLNTENMGPLLMEIKVWNKDVVANGKVTQEWVAQILKTAWPKLQESFAAMGYSLQQCDWAVGSFKEKLQPGETKPVKVKRTLRLLDTRV